MKIEDLKVGKLAYTIQADDYNGDILERATEEKPREMMFGVGRVMKRFSDGLRGLSAGDEFAFSISPEQAFGWRDEGKVTEVAIEVFMQDDRIREDLLVVGNVVKLQDGEGHPFEGKVLYVKGDHVVIDFNHPLAGHSLFVKGKVLDVRDPTIEEMNGELEYRKAHHHHCHQEHNCEDRHCPSCHE